ncbi:MAG: hypothetical protein ACREJN_21870 [Nitrospiraceae bacterium]
MLCPVLLDFTRDRDKGLQVIEAERSAIAPFTGLILERLLADILPDRRFNVAASQLVRRSATTGATTQT